MKNYRIRQSLSVIKRIENEFKDLNIDDKYYMVNIGYERAIDRLATYAQILIATNFKEGDNPIWLQIH